MQSIENLKFLTKEQVRNLASTFGTPIYVYSRRGIELSCEKALSFPNAFGITVRFAMKANPSRTVLEVLRRKGIHIDASSEHEVRRAILAGFKPQEILLTSQQLALGLKDLVQSGVQFNACSLKQLEEFGKLFPSGEVSIRFNPGLGSGATKKTDVGGKTSSFGIWHEDLSKVQDIVQKYSLKVIRIHTHIGSGSDPEVWKAVAHYTLEIAAKFPNCHTVNLGGGFKVGRMADEKTTDPQVIGVPVKELFQKFEKEHGKKLKMEIEPGSFLMVNNGAIVSRVDDVVSTGDGGFTFVKLDIGMDVNTRPALYAAKHPLVVVSKEENATRAKGEVVYVGHCCESGDIMTQEEGGGPRTVVTEIPNIDDFVVMEGAGAYCSSMSLKNYNSYPETPEVLLDLEGKFQLIRKKQTLEQVVQNELLVPL
ncbi:diaminopimelate decarboxylase [Leptospira perolatii]|uniref:Diaminopimelate decarboxylase n=1 Tax=Leptospira perolatii TaxID=2023191 RepID=A0A2M9ZIP3_9LEPT|nr:diaminopimelate decarboxylase [Leptospira perolatii]PJZ68446.1 diaminopimelate decarboxylase [Leptospira perolatii]PJZ71926.1 diaminopimelate decarboxylase [Leptospira perolatii]